VKGGFRALPDPIARPAQPARDEVGQRKPAPLLALTNLPNLPDLFTHIWMVSGCPPFHAYTRARREKVG
jgi:hypothetical protein